MLHTCPIYSFRLRMHLRTHTYTSMQMRTDNNACTYVMQCNLLQCNACQAPLFSNIHGQMVTAHQKTSHCHCR